MYINCEVQSLNTYCLLTTTLRRYTIGPKKETPTLNNSLKEQLSIPYI